MFRISRLLMKIGVLGAVATSALTLQLGFAASQDAADTPTVQTATGSVRGIARDGIRMFLGIPYAAAPVGKLRWMPPEPAAAWTKPRDATKFGAHCPQTTPLGLFAGPTSVTEDCLFLNVYSPSGIQPGAKKPVIVWIHGGGNTSGASNDYDPSKLVKGGPRGEETVVVTINYRLGLLGTFAQTAIDAEGHPSGNYNILDQIAALQWVRANIAAFGGDPDRVTAAGESAGSYDIAALMVSPDAKGLFHRAILQSGPGYATGDVHFAPAEATRKKGDDFAKEAGCDGIGATVADCLRALPIPRLLQLQGRLSAEGPYSTIKPFIDGKVVPVRPMRAWMDGSFHKMPIMAGSTEDEATFFAAVPEYFSGPEMAPAITDTVLPFITGDGANCWFCYGGKAPQGSAQVYSLEKHGNNAIEVFQRFLTDFFKCDEAFALDAMSEHVPTYAYDFTYPNAPFFFPKMPGFRADASHTIDIQFLFPDFHGGHLGVNLDQDTGMPRGLNDSETTLSDEMVAAWTRFASSGNPNGSGDEPWPAYKPGGKGMVMLQDIPSRTASMVDQKKKYQCNLWDAARKF